MSGNARRWSLLWVVVGFGRGRSDICNTLDHWTERKKGKEQRVLEGGTERGAAERSPDEGPDAESLHYLFV